MSIEVTCVEKTARMYIDGIAYQMKFEKLLTNADDKKVENANINIITKDASIFEVGKIYKLELSI